MIRHSLALGFAALLAAGSPAAAQGTGQPDFARQLEQQAIANLQGRVLGQPDYANQGYGGSPGYSPSQDPAYTRHPGLYMGGAPYPAGNSYQVQRPVYGPNAYQPPYGPNAYQPGYAQPGYQPGFPQPGYGPQGYGASAQRYQLPPQYSGYAPGTSLNYGGATYVINPDRTMSLASVAQPAAPAQRYQIPAQFAGARPGSTVTYGSANYAINPDRTMSPVR